VDVPVCPTVVPVHSRLVSRLLAAAHGWSIPVRDHPET
jgi:hypothetical protein